jgi:hypothetical protein
VRGGLFLNQQGIISNSGTAGPPWEYATLALAEASGDPWADDVDVTITGGAVFKYRSTLAVNGYSGLIHKHPWDGVGTLGSLVSVDKIYNSTAKNVDPDTWSGFTKTTNSAGLADVSGERSRLYCPTTSDWITMRGTTPPAASDVEAFLIEDNMSAGFSGTDSSGGAAYAQTQLYAYIDGTNKYTLEVMLRRINSTTFWAVRTGPVTYAVTTKSVSVERRLWLYKKASQWAVWFDADSVPELSGTGDLTTGEGANPGSSLTQANSGAATSAVFHKLSQHVSGAMTT